jgi:hypothetical protein
MMFKDVLFIDNPRSWPPCEPASDPDWIKHVHCDSARWHTPSWGLYHSWRGERAIERCSQACCIVNKIAAEQLAEIGIKATFVTHKDGKILPRS